MQEELLKRLDLLAAKFGVATEYLFAALVKQVYVDAVYAGIWFIAGVVLAFKIKPVWKRLLDLEDDWDRFASVLWLIFSSVAALFIFGVSVSVILQVLNPEYAAIQEILKVLK